MSLVGVPLFGADLFREEGVGAGVERSDVFLQSRPISGRERCL